MLYHLLFLLNLAFSSQLYGAVEKKILIIGDSLTEGYKVEKSESWPKIEKKKLNKDTKYKDYEVVNAGSSGATSAYGISVMKFHLKRYQPRLIVYALGANDGLRARPPEETKKDIEKAILLAKKNKVDFLLIGMKAPPNYGKKFPKNFEKTYSDLAKKYNLPFMPFLLEGVAGNPSYNQADGIHPNAKGYVIIADNIYPYIIKALK